MRFDPEFLTAWRVYKNKGPVNYPTSQRAADRAYRVVKEYLTPEEQSKLAIAWSHATFTGEGRSEFDGVCKKIEERLFKPGGLNLSRDRR